MSIDATVLVLAKAPQPGRVKTRLCPPCTPEQAADIAAAALADTLDTVAAVPARRRVLVIDGPIESFVPAGFEIVPQVGGGLGERLAAAFAAAKGPAFLVGMDTPQVPSSTLRDALARLDEPGVDAALGLATDGGWWGLGLAGPVPSAFEGVPMSSSRTGASQLARLGNLGLRTHFLPELRDVDHFADALEVAIQAPTSRFAGVVDRVNRALAVRT